MKKILTIIFVFCLSFTFFQEASARSTSENINNLAVRWEKVKINKFIKNMVKYSNQKDIEKIKECYTSDFQNTDNFSQNEYFKMIEETFNTYSNLKYKIKIKEIERLDNGYKVTLEDKTSGLINSESPNFKYGILNCESLYELYMREYDGKFKIYRDNVLEETTSLTYGEASIVKMELITPNTIQQGEEYTIGLKIYPWSKSFIIASINNEPIESEPINKEEIFRKMPKDGLLERIVQANKDKKHEYALASVGFTKASLGEDKLSINFKMSGVGFLIKRINIEKDEGRIEG